MKILILSASPQRDAVIDEQLKAELEKLGNEVKVFPMLRAGRKAILEERPDVVTIPPIRNPHARDFAEVCKRYRVGVVSRHTEASCDWQDYKKMDQGSRHMNILGGYPYMIDLEIVWGPDEAQILAQRGVPFPAIAVGCMVADIYKKKDIRKRFDSRDKYLKGLGLDPKKKTVVVSASWGFADSAPDLQIDEMRDYREEYGKDRFVGLVKRLRKHDWNILVRPHPGLDASAYEALATCDSKSKATQVLIGADALIHSGSTMAIECHLLGVPAFQYGDTNRSFTDNWFQAPGSPISKISPHFKSMKKLIEAIGKTPKKTNADPKTLVTLEKGRFGPMDGKAIERMAQLISKVKGKFQDVWPRAHREYDKINIFKSDTEIIQRTKCGVCEQNFCVVKEEWKKKYCKALLDVVQSKTTIDSIAKEIIEKAEIPEPTHCPGCAARLFVT